MVVDLVVICVCICAIFGFVTFSLTREISVLTKENIRLARACARLGLPNQNFNDIVSVDNESRSHTSMLTRQVKNMSGGE